MRDGHTYSDKAPLQPVLAVPFYAAYRVVGGEPAVERRLDENLGLWWITFWMATVPAAILAALMYRSGRRVIDGDRLPATAALFFGSILFPFAALLFGHALAALFVFGAFLVLTSGELTPRSSIVGGMLCGAAVATEYTAAVAVVVFTVLVLRRSARHIGWFVLGGAPFAAGLAWYHTVAFGTPLTHPYRYTAFNEVTEEARGFFETFATFKPEHLVELVFDGRGFLFSSPIILVGLVGLVWLIRQGSASQRRDAIVAAAVFAGFVLIPVFWSNPWGGDSPGPRYMTPAFPLLVLGVAAVWRRSRIWGRAAAALGVLTMALATLTDPLLSDDARVSIGSWIQLAADGDIVPTVFTIAVGPLGWILHMALIALVARALIRAAAGVSTEPARV